MEKNHDLNKELREELSALFTGLLKDIGNHRQQLLNKVLSVHKTIFRELDSMKLDANRQDEIRHEIKGLIKALSHQLPHLKQAAIPKPAPSDAPRTVVTPKPIATPTPKPAPAAASSKKSTTSPPKKAGPAKKKK